MTADVSWIRTSGASVAVLRGRIDSTNAAKVHRMLEAGADPNERALILDLEHLSFISSAGLRVMLVLAKEYRNQEKGFQVCALSPAIREIFRVSGFDRIISIHPTRALALAEARAALAADPKTAAGAAEWKEIYVKSAVDFGIVGENIMQIADFAIDKYEFTNNDVISEEVRDEAMGEIKYALWERVNLLKKQRMNFLAALFETAERRLDEVVKRNR